MLGKIRNLVERHIQKAQAEGQFENLEGEGKPLADGSGEAYLNPVEAVGYRMMAEAGALPAEFKLKAELAEARKAWQAAETEADKKALMAKIADLDLRYSIATEARRNFLR